MGENDIDIAIISNNKEKVFADYLEIKSQLLTSSKEEIERLLENININHQSSIELKESFREFTGVNLKGFSIKDIIKILNYNNSFDFYNLNKIIEGYTNDITPEKVIKILEIKPNFDFSIINNSKDEYLYGLSIDKVIWILENNPDFDFHLLALNIKKLKGKLDIEEIIKILEIQTNFDFSILHILKNLFGNNFSIDKIIKIIEIQHFFYFPNLIEIKKYFGNEFTIDKTIEILEIQPNFLIENLINSKIAFGEDFSIEKFIQIIKDNEGIDICRFFQKKILDNGKYKIVEINQISPKKISLDDIINIYKVYNNIDIVRLSWLIININRNESIKYKKAFIEKFLIKLFNEDYTLPGKKNYLGNNNEFKSFFYNEPGLKYTLNNLIRINIVKIIRVGSIELMDIEYDPAYINLRRIIEKGLILNENMEVKLIIARNLYFYGKEINQYNVNYEYNRWIKNKESYENISLFKDRNIIFTSHHEDWKPKIDKIYRIRDGDIERFGEKDTIRGIKIQGGKLPNENNIHPENNVKSLKDAKIKTLEKIKNTPIPMTFVFDGHGQADAIYLSGGEYIDGNKQNVEENDKVIKITFQELTHAFIGRSKNKNIGEITKKEQKDILIFSSCFNHTFLRNLYHNFVEYNKINNPKINLPICIGMSEFGQKGYSYYGSKYGNNFFGKVFDFEGGDDNTTIGDVNYRQGELETSNPSIYVPDENNLPMQIG